MLCLQYELVRSSAVLKKQASLLQSLALPRTTSHRRPSWVSEHPADTLAHILTVTDFYEAKIRLAGARSAKDAMRVVAKEIEAEGLHQVANSQEIEDPP